jgi:uncharacterized protein (DUF433 family)
MYTISQAAKLGRTTPQTVRRWLYGVEQPGHSMRPVFGERDEDGPRLSFLELSEVLVVARFRRREGKRIPLDRLRRAHAFARERLGIAHPFASGRFQLEGGHIMHDFDMANPGKGKIAIDLEGQYVLPVGFQDALSLFDFDPSDSMALRWYPHGKDSPIVMDPEVSGGWPTIKGFNIRLETISQRFRDGWEVEEIAEDFDIEPKLVQRLLRLLLEMNTAA